MKNKKYIVYETTNLINGRYYIGVHVQYNSGFDGYLGSGKILQEAVKKYGRENFDRVTLFTYATPEEAYAKEAEIVNLFFLSEYHSYNICVGGHGGSHQHSDETKLKMSITRTGIKLSENHKKKIGASNTGNVSWITGKVHSNETKLKMSMWHTGKKFSDESKEKMSKSRSNVKYNTYNCMFCGKSGKGPGFIGWHFEYCKENPNRNLRKNKE